jgi:hypothetical protein
LEKGEVATREGREADAADRRREKEREKDMLQALRRRVRGDKVEEGRRADWEREWERRAEFDCTLRVATTVRKRQSRVYDVLANARMLRMRATTGGDKSRRSFFSFFLGRIGVLKASASAIM